MRFLLVLLAAAGMACGQNLVGTWKLVKAYETRPNGEQLDAYGKNPVGVLMYDDRGNMSAQIQMDGKNADGETYLAYFGTYKIDKEMGAVAHVVKGSSRLSFRGTTQLRFVMLDGNRLTLGVPPQGGAGEMRLRTVVWERSQ